MSELNFLYDPTAAELTFRDRLVTLPLFEQFHADEIEALAGELEWLCIPGGWELFA